MLRRPPSRRVARGSDGGGLVRLGRSHRGVPLGSRSADLLGGGHAGLLDPGRGIVADLLGLGLRLGGTLLGFPARGLGGLEPVVRLHRRVARLLGVGLGLAPAVRLTGGFSLGVGKLLGRLSLHCLYLRLGRPGVSGPGQLRGDVCELACQRGHVGLDALAQLGRPRGGHGDRPAQVLGFGGAALAELRAAPERGQRAVRLPGQRVRLPAVLRLGANHVLGGARLVLTAGVRARDVGRFGRGAGHRRAPLAGSRAKPSMISSFCNDEMK